MKQAITWILRLVAGALAMLAFGTAHTQTPSSTPVTLGVTVSDKAAVSAAKRVHRRARMVNGATRAEEPLSDAQAQALASATNARSNSDKGAGVRYPGDLFYLGGQTVQRAQSHNIYINARGACRAPGCWGDPEQFLQDLATSDFIHVTDQYTGLSSSRRYTLGHSYAVAYPTASPAYTDDDMLTIAHAAALASGQSGYGHIYHLFLTPGTDECFDNTYSVCYSPDNPATWFFCAYHGSVDFPDVGHVLYSVEPYQKVAGCWVQAGTPNGRLIDSTNDVLSHELFETITDPDGDGWWQYYGGGMFGQEIGDECVFLTHNGDQSSAPFIFRMGGQRYATQPEYDNSAHGCTVGSSQN